MTTPLPPGAGPTRFPSTSSATVVRPKFSRSRPRGIEGFYDACRSSGLTGRQGALIPGANVSDLMLRKDVVEAVAEGRFRIYTASTVEEGIELLTGVEAGLPNEEGEFDGDTVYGLVQKRLAKMAKDAGGAQVGKGRIEKRGYGVRASRPMSRSSRSG